MELELGGIILAGGRSARLGREKALLKWHGELLIQRAVRLMQTVCAEVVVVTSSEAVRQAVPVRTVPDVQPGRGPLGGLYAGLQAMSQEYKAVVACDMPGSSRPPGRLATTLPCSGDPRAGSPCMPSMPAIACRPSPPACRPVG